MDLSERRKAGLGLVILVTVGSGLFAIHLGHALEEEENLQTFLLGIALPLFLALGLLASSVRLWRSDLDGPYFLRLAVWCSSGGGALAVWALLLLLHQRAEGATLSHPEFVVANAITGGCVVGLVVGAYDVRQRIAQSQAEDVSHRLTVLNRILRHDVRNRANVIHGRAEFVDPTNGSEDHLETIRRQAVELVELGDNARSIEKLIYGDDERESLDIGTILEKQLDRLEEDYPNVVTEISAPTQPYVSAHPLIESALANILENAVEHNDKPSPRVTVECSRTSDAESEHYDIRIADNGPGIPAAELDVLERGYETPLEHTTGLGLWLINWIVTASDGEVWFEENSPDGSIVCVQLEAAKSTTSTPESTPG